MADLCNRVTDPGVSYETKTDKTAHVALVMGDIGDGKDVLVRVTSEGAAVVVGELEGQHRASLGIYRPGTATPFERHKSLNAQNRHALVEGVAGKSPSS